MVDLQVRNERQCLSREGSGNARQRLRLTSKSLNFSQNSFCIRGSQNCEAWEKIARDL